MPARGGNRVPAAASKQVKDVSAGPPAALRSLDEEHRTVMVLRHIESFDYRAIAEILDVPVGTVKSRLHRARMLLRDRLQPVLFEV